jgi:GT2 family glycosyltransferase
MAEVLTGSAPARAGVLAPPRISLIVLNWNGRRHLDACLRSLQALDYPGERLELILCDNGSRDDSADLVRSRFPDVRLIRLDRNYGFAEGNNRAVSAATGEWVGFLNNDMRVEPGWLNNMLSPLNAQPALACIGSRILNWEGSAIDFIGGGVNFEGHGFQLDHGERRSERDRSRRVLFACGGAMLIRSQIYRETGGFDNDYFAYFEDVDFGWRLNLLGHDVWYTSEATVFHRHHGTAGQIPYHKLRVLYERNALFTIYKGFDDQNLAAVLPVALLLTNERAIRLAGLDPGRFELDGLAGSLLAEPVLAPETSPNGSTRSAGGLVGKARRVLEQHGAAAMARKTFAYSRRELGLRVDGALRALTPGSIVMPTTAASHYVALAAFARSLPQLNEKRRRIQAQRVRSDAEILPLLANALFPSYPEPAYQRFHGWISKVMGLDQRFASPPQA